MMKFRNVLALVATVAAINASSAAEQSIVLASTTSVEASGLLANILPQFTAKTGITVNVVAQGTGKALDTARRGDADLLLVHDPEAEQAFMDEGHGSTRRQIAWNDFIIVGPSADPARVKGGNDSVAALKAIATSQAPFVSRGDKSGTNAAELRLWKIAGQTPDVLNKEKWYRDIGGGMGQALNAASAMDAYTLSDRGTWLSFGNKGSLVVAIEGDPRLVNRYDVIELNPEKHAGVKLAAAKVFADWLVSLRRAASHRRVSSEWAKAVQPVRRFAEIVRFLFSAELLFFATAGRRSAHDLVRSGSARDLRTRVEPLSLGERVLSRRHLARTSDVGSQRHQLLADRAGGGAFDLAVACDEREAERGQDGAAAVLAAGLPLDGGMAADAVDLVEPDPRRVCTTCPSRGRRPRSNHWP